MGEMMSENSPDFIEIRKRVIGAAVFAGMKRTEDFQKAIEYLAARAKQADECEEVLRGLAAYVSAGGYNAAIVDPDEFNKKIRWGIDRIPQVEVNWGPSHQPLNQTE